MNNQGLSNTWAQVNDEENTIHPVAQNSNINIKTEAQDNIDVDEDSMNALENELMRENEMWSNLNTYQGDTGEQYYAYDGVDLNAQNEGYDNLEDKPLHHSEKVKRKRRGRKSAPKISSSEMVSVCYWIFIL